MMAISKGTIRHDRPRMFLNNCPIRERTADRRSVGRCWFFCKDSICPRHGDVTEALDHYRSTGELTDQEIP